jgi:hypothetical protein
MRSANKHRGSEEREGDVETLRRKVFVLFCLRTRLRCPSSEASRSLRRSHLGDAERLEGEHEREERLRLTSA